MDEKIKLIKSNGTTIEADVICFLEDTTSTKKYIYYTLNELFGVDPSSTVKIYVGKVRQNDVTDVPISEEEWGKLKGVMGEVLKDSENATIKYLPLSSLVDPTIIDEKVIAMPTMYDYINKHRAVYTNKAAEINTSIEVSNNESVPVQEQVQTFVQPTETAELVPENRAEDIQSQESITPVPAEQTNTVLQNTEPVAPETTAPTLDAIDIASIEAKYAQMIAEINELKNKEIEAAKRYNATLELSAMHNAQHASYVQSVQDVPAATGVPTSEIKMETSVAPQISPMVEPKSVEPSPIEPQQINNVDIETNWFDMQPQG